MQLVLDPDSQDDSQACLLSTDSAVLLTCFLILSGGDNMCLILFGDDEASNEKVIWKLLVISMPA